MTISNGYATLTELKAYLDISDPEDDPKLENVITATSRWIDQELGRRFYTASETRYFTAHNPRLCIVDDLQSITTLSTDYGGDGTFETTWTSTDYNLWPYNASTDSKPYSAIEAAPAGNYSFPTVRRGVSVAGVFGYSAATPDVIREACLLMSARVFKRKDLVYGISGSVDLGTLTVIGSVGRDDELMKLLGSIGKRVTHYGSR